MKKDWRDELGGSQEEVKKVMNHAAQNNIHIIHFDVNGNYMCNQACRAYEIKLTRDFRKVSCLNCKNKIINELKEGKDNANTING